METKPLLLTMLQRVNLLVVPMLEDLRSAPLVTPTDKGGNHALWIAGHLAVSEGGMIHEMMRGLPSPVPQWKDLFSRGTQPSTDNTAYPPYEELLAKLKELRGETINLLESLSENDLDQAPTRAHPSLAAFFGTWRDCFMMAGMHWTVHRGQLADCRRAAGRTEPVLF